MLPSGDIGKQMVSCSIGYGCFTLRMLQDFLIRTIEMVGNSLIFIASLLACTALVTKGVDASLVGLMISYGLNTTGALVRTF